LAAVTSDPDRLGDELDPQARRTRSTCFAAGTRAHRALRAQPSAERVSLRPGDVRRHGARLDLDPGAFPPVTIPIGNPPNRAATSTAESANNTPIGLAIDAGATDVTIVFLEPPDAPGGDARRSPNLGEIGLACFSVMQQKILDSDLRPRCASTTARSRVRSHGAGSRCGRSARRHRSASA